MRKSVKAAAIGATSGRGSFHNVFGDAGYDFSFSFSGTENY